MKNMFKNMMLTVLCMGAFAQDLNGFSLKDLSLSGLFRGYSTPERVSEVDAVHGSIAAEIRMAAVTAFGVIAAGVSVGWAYLKYCQLWDQRAGKSKKIKELKKSCKAAKKALAQAEKREFMASQLAQIERGTFNAATWVAGFLLPANQVLNADIRSLTVANNRLRRENGLLIQVQNRVANELIQENHKIDKFLEAMEAPR